MIALLQEDMLRELGAEVVGTVGSVGAIVGAVEKGMPDVVLLDVNINGERVYGAAAALRARDVPFVFVSGYQELPDCPPDLCGVPQLRKPFRPGQLAAALGEALARGGRT